MVKFLSTMICLLLLLCKTQVDAATPQLIFELDKLETEWGKSIHSTLYAVDFPREIVTSDLQILETDFGIVVTDEGIYHTENKRWPNQDVQVVHVDLHPRRIGKLKVQQILIDDYYSQEHIINVKPGTVKGKPIEITTHTSTTIPWERQQVLFNVEISTPELFTNLEVEEFTAIPGFEVVALPTSKKRTITSSGTKIAVLQQTWAIFPLIPGERSIRLPAIHYKLSGQVERTYFLPDLQLNIRALPPYVPPTMPVADIAIASAIDASFLLNTDSLYYWNLSLKSPSLLPYWMPPVLSQITGNKQIKILQIDTRRTMNPEPRGVNGHIIHQIPFKANASGMLTLPRLSIQTFDPISGRMKTVTQAEQRFFVLSVGWRWILGAMFAALLLWGFKLLLKRWQFVHNRTKKRHIAVEKLKRSQNAIDIRDAIKILGHAEGLPLNLSLTAWAMSWQTNRDPNFEKRLKRISRFCYRNPKDNDLDTIRTDLIEIAKQIQN